MPALDMVQYDPKGTDVYVERYRGESRVLCRCKKCADKSGNAPVYERSLYYTRHQCARHMVEERGPPTGSSPLVDSEVSP